MGSSRQPSIPPMPEEVTLLVGVLVGAVGLAILGIRFGILLGGYLARQIDRDPEEEENQPRGPAR